MPNRTSDVPWDLDDGGQDGALSPRRIVDAAIALADRSGIGAVTIRAVATEVDARPMSLYTHVPSKAALLALMANEMIDLMLVDELPEDDWRAALTAIARRAHTMFVTHPWAFEAFARRPQLGPNAGRRARQMAAAIEGTGLAPRDGWIALGILDDFVLGHASRVSAVGVAGDLADAEPPDGDTVPGLPDLVVVDAARGTSESFELGLATVLDGIERRFVRRGALGPDQRSRATDAAGEAAVGSPGRE